MKNSISYTTIFYKRLKIYKRKHRSLVADLEALEKELLENPTLGISLGNNLYKIRLAVESKGKGKSGGYRIITYLIDEHKTGTIVNMLILYDKSEESSIDKENLLRLVRILFS
ncbi:addiction module toxin RelE (plasmid) [Pedobacter sp. BS3]|uniref:addiction module toxin RelE n=1 Tax=Pedobacter sp. BS3 TaxID=2567937 RepID=UPI0011ED3D87|nr:addiction module toxin RelE [Pedobacter sp. BS3]TZF85856.1 addiction module toxin RelE [Pedobacter sp. BS3]